MKIILIAYINCTGIPSDQISKEIEKVKNLISSDKEDEKDIKWFVVPTKESTKIECIYPMFISSEEKIKETQEKLDEINRMFIENLKKNI